MVNLTSSTVKIGGRFYNKDKSGYPSSPTIFSGVEVQWGADSCIEHPEAARATLSLWVPKAHSKWLPALGEVVEIDASIADTGITSTRIFTGKVESIKLQDDKKAPDVQPISLKTSKVGWTTRQNETFPSDPRIDWSANVAIMSDETLQYQFGGTGTNWFYTKTPKFTVVGGKSYSLHWESNYFGSYSAEVRYYNGAGAQLGATQTTNNIKEHRVSFTAPTDAVQVDVEVFAGMTPEYEPVATSWLGRYWIGRFIVGFPEAAGYRVNITAADALAEAARLRLSDTIWPYEFVLNRQNRIAELATKSGVNFYGGLTEAQGYYEALGTSVRARDVDSFPALEAFQLTTMAAGHTVISSNNVVQPSIALNLPQVLLGDPNASVVYGFTGTSSAGQHTETTNGVVTRTNWASNATTRQQGLHFTMTPGTSGVTDMQHYSYDTKHGDTRNRVLWTTGSTTYSTATAPGAAYKQVGITGASGSRVSAGMWVRTGTLRSFRPIITLYSGTTAVGTYAGAITSCPAGEWTYLKVDGATATGAYDTVELFIQAQSAMSTGHYIDIDSVLIEKTAFGGVYFDQYSLAPDTDVLATIREGVPTFSSSVIRDDVFELDTSNVVNEIKVELKRFIGTAGEPGWEAKDEANVDFDQVFTDEVGSRKTTPQTRSISSDWTIRDGYMEAELPTSVMVTKGKLLLSGQSQPQWRLSSALALVVKEVPAQAGIYDLINELTRFGSLVHLEGAPSLVPAYMRVRGGRIVLGKDPELEFELEPVEYSAPIPLSGVTLSADDVASNYLIKNFKTLTSNDLRTIGAR